MSDSEELDEIRRRKRERLERRLAEGEPDDTAGTPETPTEPIHVDSESHLSEIVSTHDVVLVDFYADWCGPCKMLEPAVAGLARDSPAAVAKVDIDTHQGLASQYRVQGVPTLLLFSDGEPVERVVGVRDQGSLASLVSEYAG
jgi:thioredoxin 1